MKEDKRLIAYFFIAVTMILVGHAITPHHHHLETHQITEEEDCLNSNHNPDVNEDHSDSHEHHCHAFNYARWYPDRSYKIKNPQNELYVGITTYKHSHLLFNSSNYEFQKLLLHNFISPDNNSELYRGPPAIS